ncbi:MAG: FAD-dependent oxidoreductase [Betaproteobacteria bacterium]|nr:FAD-dependent oxidoreductase [Betaproteobacteria bacterium]
MSRHVVIIGAGVIGAMSAIHALRDGHRVTILEPETPGGEQASSYGNAGWLSSHSVIPPSQPGVWKKVPGYLLDPLGPLAIRWGYLPQALPWLLRYLAEGATKERVTRTARALRTLLVESPVLHRAVAEQAGVAHLIVHEGVLHVYPSRADFDAEALNWSVRREVGVRWQELSAAELHQREPALDERYTFGVFVAEAGHCRDPGAYVAALVAHACALGATLVQGQATGFRIEAGRLRAVRTAGSEIACEAAVIAAGGRSKALAAAAGDRVALEVERGYHVMIAQPEGAPRTPMMAADCKAVATLTEGGLRLAGQVEIAAFDAAPDWRRADILRDQLLRMFPALPRELAASRVRYWLGRRPSTPDGLPCIGPARACRDIIHAYGHGHVGMVAAARTGRLVGQLLSGRTPEIPLEPFDPRRFG